jgi:GGDEF domain-containing protein
MLGALLTFLGSAAVEALRNPTLAAWRAVGFIALMGSAAMLMCGWFEYVVAIADPVLLLPAKVTLGPLSGALALYYLGIWFGKIAQDPWLDRVISWGSVAQCLAALALLVSALVWPDSGHALLWSAFGVNLLSVLLALLAATRGVTLGDQLARGMVVACICLAVMVSGLYAKGVGLQLSPWMWALTAVCTSAYFLITTVLSIQRNRQLNLIKRMSEGIAQKDEITGLPVGGLLLSKMDDALWRSGRLNRECAVLAVWVDNLYVFNDELDRSIEHEIQHVLTARIHRAVGFRHTLGLLQARCFVSAVSAVSERTVLTERIRTLAYKLQQPLQVGVLLGKTQIFEPQIAIGLVWVDARQLVDPLVAMDQAQSLAQKALRTPQRVLFEDAKSAAELASQRSAHHARV